MTQATYYLQDANGNLETVTDPLGGVTTFVYDSVDRLTEKHLPNGVTSTYTYDDRDRVLSVVHTGASGVLASVTYVRSVSGEPTRITREDGSYVDLTYDAALRLDTETYYTSGGTLVDAIDYDYDDDGNRTRKTSLAGGVEDYNYSAGFRLDSVTKSSGTDSFGYDGAGRVTSINRDGGTQTLTYNSDDKLTRVVGGATDVQYTYDGVGRRVAKVEGGATTRYLVAPNLGDGFETPQAVTDASGNVLASYVFAGEHPLMRIEGGVATYYLQDAMGSVVGMAGASGSSVASIKYDGFGNVTSSSGVGAGIDPNIGFDFRLHGMALDSSSGLYHVRARTYDPRTGRFTSRDPWSGRRRRPETKHPYIFNGENPSLFRDPSGFDFGIPFVDPMAWAVHFTLGEAAFRKPRDLLKLDYKDPVTKAVVTSIEKTIDAVRVYNLLDVIYKTEYGKQIVKHAVWLSGASSWRAPTIFLRPGQEIAQTDQKTRDIDLDPGWHPVLNTDQGLCKSSTTRLLAHELAHSIMGAEHTEASKMTTWDWEYAIMKEIDGGAAPYSYGRTDDEGIGVEFCEIDRF